MDEEQEIQIVRSPVQPGGLSLPMIVPQQPSVKRADDLSDLFEVPQPEDNDIYTDDLVELEVEDVFGGSPDMSDILSVSQADIMGRKPKPKVKFSRTAKLYPPTGIGGVQ